MSYYNFHKLNSLEIYLSLLFKQIFIWNVWLTLVPIEYFSNMVKLNLLRVYFEVSRLIGLCNLHYDSRTQRFRLYHVPTLVYCSILDIAYILILPFALILLTGNLYKCPQIGMFRAVYNVVGLSKFLTMLLLICNVWIQRRRLHQIGNDFMEMLHKFRFALHKDCRKKCLWKVFLTGSRFIIFTQQLVFRDSLVRCENDFKLRKAMLPYNVAAIFYSWIMILMVSYVDLTIYIIQVAGNWFVVNMSQSVQEMIQDLEALPKRNGIPREMGLRQISSAWRKLWRQCLQLDKVLKQTVNIFEWQLLLNLLTTYIFNIATLFRLWIYLEFDKNFQIGKGIFFAVLFLVYHVEILMQFFIFEINRTKWLEVRNLVVKLSYANISGNNHKYSQGIILSRQLEFSLWYLNRRLQPNPQRVRRLHILGLFDLNNATVHKMTRSVLTNVLVLCQIAYKIYG
ncbi:putative gustatory receptor 58c [Drosophila ficusphila]|uniref:putative gustatory receptor 58c n=1 Tax=Drosophila ficusphila TaxID=30025 RepID=UPI0007E86E05|nr:putative gustatory receptor 58c [Drosophila ficusphila]